MSEPYYNTDYFTKYDSTKINLPLVGFSLVMWCCVIHFFIIIPKESTNWFEKSVLALPFLYVIAYFSVLRHSYFGGPELNTGCLKFEKNKKSSEGIMGKWFWNCSMQQIHIIANYLNGQVNGNKLITYGLLLLMLVTTSFKRNMLDIPIIKSFSVVQLIITTVILFNLQFGLWGASAGFLLVLNSILTSMGISSFLIVLLNLRRLR